MSLINLSRTDVNVEREKEPEEMRREEVTAQRIRMYTYMFVHTCSYTLSYSYYYFQRQQKLKHIISTVITFLLLAKKNISYNTYLQSSKSICNDKKTFKFKKNISCKIIFWEAYINTQKVTHIMELNVFIICRAENTSVMYVLK